MSPRIYGLPKIHKSGVPLRPIVSCINGPTYNLSKFLSGIFYKSIDHSKYNIRNSYDFKEFITNQKLPQNYVLISLDVVSLFTKIPLNLVMDNIDRRWHTIAKHTTIPLVEFREMVNFALVSNYFVYEGKYYYQRSGTPMGSCLSPAIADMVMEILLDTVKKKLCFELPFIKKYVDDLITAIPNGKEDTILNIFNAYNVDLQFTIEKEVEARLPFLDMMLIRNVVDGSISTEWYMKPTSSGRILNYYSDHHYNQKINTALGLIQRVVRLTSDVNENTFAVVKKILSKNNYPVNIVNRLISRTLHVSNGTVNVPALNHAVTEPLLKMFKSITFTGDVTYSIIRTIKTEFPHIMLGFKCPKTLALVFSKLKDPIDHWQQSNVIYEIPCGQCDKKYVGLTTRKLLTRVSEHERDYNSWLKIKTSISDLNNCDNIITRLSNKTAALKHVIDCEHQFRYTDTKILTSELSLNKLKILEMLHINDRETVNMKTDTEGVNLYKGLLSNIKNTLK